MSKSNFFHDFSIRELLNKNQYLAKPTPQDRMPGIGGIAGGIGGGSGCAGVGAVRSRQESFSAAINPAKAAEFDATRFIESLRADVEAEMQDSALTVTSADIFGSAGFSIDYAAPGSHGRVHIIVRRSLDSNNLHITASVEEKRTDPNAAGWSEMSWPRKRNIHPPQGTYYVVTFPDDDVRAHSRRFYYRGQEALDGSRERIRRLRVTERSNSGTIENLSYAEVYVWQAIPSEIKDKLRVIGRHFDILAEYDGYSIVYFLNETALRMYREAGEEFDVLKTVGEEEMLQIPGPQLRGPYLPDSR